MPYLKQNSIQSHPRIQFHEAEKKSKKKYAKKVVKKYVTLYSHNRSGKTLVNNSTCAFKSSVCCLPSYTLNRHQNRCRYEISSQQGFFLLSLWNRFRTGVRWPARWTLAGSRPLPTFGREKIKLVWWKFEGGVLLEVKFWRGDCVAMRKRTISGVIQLHDYLA